MALGELSGTDFSLWVSISSPTLSMGAASRTGRKSDTQPKYELIEYSADPHRLPFLTVRVKSLRYLFFTRRTEVCIMTYARSAPPASTSAKWNSGPFAPLDTRIGKRPHRSLSTYAVS